MAKKRDLPIRSARDIALTRAVRDTTGVLGEEVARQQQLLDFSDAEYGWFLAKIAQDAAESLVRYLEGPLKDD